MFYSLSKCHANQSWGSEQHKPIDVSPTMFSWSYSQVVNYYQDQHLELAHLGICQGLIQPEGEALTRDPWT